MPGCWCNQITKNIQMSQWSELHTTQGGNDCWVRISGGITIRMGKSKEVLLQFHIILNATQATGVMTEAILEPHLTWQNHHTGQPKVM